MGWTHHTRFVLANLLSHVDALEPAVQNRIGGAVQEAPHELRVVGFDIIHSGVSRVIGSGDHSIR